MTRTAICMLALAATLAAACGSTSTSSSPSSPTPVTSGSGGGCSLPAAPANLAASVADTRVTLTWSASAGATEYIVLIGSSPSSSNELSTNTTNTTYQWNGASTGKHYARIEAKNSCGTSAASNEVAFTVQSTSFGG